MRSVAISPPGSGFASLAPWLVASVLLASPLHAQQAAEPLGEDNVTVLTALEVPARALGNPGAGLVDPAEVSQGGAYRLMDTRLSYPAFGAVAQAASAPGAAAAGAAATPEAPGASASDLNKQLSNPVTSIWSLSFQFKIGRAHV